MTVTTDIDDPLRQLYDDFARDHLNPLWTQVGDLMPMLPTPKAIPYVWKWSTLYPLAQRAGDLVPVGRGGERRAIALANPGLGGAPYRDADLVGGDSVPRARKRPHRNTGTPRTLFASSSRARACGPWSTAIPSPMRRGDLLLTPGWNFHGHHNETDAPMAWIDGLDIPFVSYTDTGFFEFGSDRVTDERPPTCHDPSDCGPTLGCGR